MEKFHVHILGCGSAMPTLRHLPSCQVVDIREKLFMIDCGEGAQLELRRQGLKFSRIQAIFITHLHGDHCLGLPGLLSTFSLLGRTQALHIYAPRVTYAGPTAEEVFYPILQNFSQGLEFDVIFHDIDANQVNTIYEDRSLKVTTLPLKHRIPCCGFLFEEKPILPHIRKDMVDFLHIPLYAINGIKEGNGWTDENGKFWSHEQLTIASYTPRCYAYCSDTLYQPQLANTIRELLEVSPSKQLTLYHEATFGNDQKKRCVETFHSTAQEAAQTASNCHAQKLIIGHYSARYENTDFLLEEAKTYFPNTFAATEGLCIEL